MYAYLPGVEFLRKICKFGERERKFLRGSFKVARYAFSGSIPPKFEHKLRRHEKRFGKIATTVVLDKDKDLLWSGYNSDFVIATLIITNFHLYLIQFWWQFFQVFVFDDVVYAQTWEVLTSQSCSAWQQRNVPKKAWCTCKVVVLVIKTYCFFDFLVAVARVVES